MVDVVAVVVGLLLSCNVGFLCCDTSLRLLLLLLLRGVVGVVLDAKDLLLLTSRLLLEKVNHDCCHNALRQQEEQ